MKGIQMIIEPNTNIQKSCYRLRYNNQSLITRINKGFPGLFICHDMTTYASLTLIDHYLKLRRINFRLKQTLKIY